jgi:7-cyano-7-deazaguanine synthase in queuosine biosynthesis
MIIHGNWNFDKNIKYKVCWSGGYDSTYLIIKLLEEKINFSTLSIISDQMPSMEIQRQRRIQIKKVLVSQFNNFPSTEAEIKYLNISIHQGMTQQPLILFNSLMSLEIDENLMLGYIKGDDFYTHNYNFESLSDYLAKIRYRTYNIYCPLAYMHKYELFDTLKKYKVDKLVWTCENSDSIVPCNKCETCVKLRLAKYEYNLQKEINNKKDVT